MVFPNRQAAAQLLSKKLHKYKKENPLVLAIPRGAVPMGKVVADNLQCDLDVLLVRKIGAPGNPEFAIGAVSEYGDVYLSSAKDEYGISKRYIDETIQHEMQTIKKRRASYTPIRKAVPLKDRTVIILDDGIATGSTMISAIHAARLQKAKKIIVATPVASREAFRLLEIEADELLVLDVPALFWAVGDFYEDFSQVTDDEVSQLLAEAAQSAA